MQSGKLPQASPTRAGLPSNPRWELGSLLLFPEDVHSKPSCSPGKASGHHPQYLSAPNSAPGTQQ